MSRVSLGFVALCFAALSFAACGSTLALTPLNASPRPLSAIDPAAVQMFTSGVPTRPFVEVALLEVQQTGAASLDDSSRVLGKLRVAAARHGCDGVILNDSANSTIGSSRTVHTLVGYRATCIVFAASNP